MTPKVNARIAVSCLTSLADEIGIAGGGLSRQPRPANDGRDASGGELAAPADIHGAPKLIFLRVFEHEPLVGQRLRRRRGVGCDIRAAGGNPAVRIIARR